MKQLTLTDLQRRPREAITSEVIADWLEIKSQVNYSEQLLNNLVRALNIQDGTAVIEFNCGKAAITTNFSSGVYYQGVVTEDIDLTKLKRFYPNGIFTKSNVLDLLIGEPTKAFGLAIVNWSDKSIKLKEGLCTEYINSALEAELLLEVALKSVVDGGLVVIISDERVNAKQRATLHAEINTHGFYITILEATAKLIKVEAVASTFEELTVKIPIASSDPRPFSLTKWDIKMVYEPSRRLIKTTQVVRKGKHIGLKFSSATDAYTWCGNVLSQDAINPWFKAVSKIKLDFYNYLRLKQSRQISEICLLKSEIKVEEANDLKKHLQKLSKRLSTNLLSYPNHTSISNRYWSLGPGDFLQNAQGELFKVIYTEVDPTDDKPPKLTIEKV